jgi:lysophospholipase L1-like esterase
MARPFRLLTALFVLFAAGWTQAATPDDFFFKKGDRIVFLGDSITEQYQYSTYIELYLTTRFPDWNLTFINAGIGGDTATGGARRFADHVLAERPTAVTIDFGMNDGRYGAFKKDLNDQYVKNTDVMLAAAKKAGVRVALISPNAVEVGVKPGLRTYLETQKQFYAPLHDLAEKYADAFVDQYAITRSALEKIDAEHAPVKPFPDGVHTSPPGALLMAHTILVGLNAPATVSDVRMDLQKDGPPKSIESQNCTISHPKMSPTGGSFERTDRALPLPIQKDWTAILPFVDQLKDLNSYGLTVMGLADGNYEVLIDGHSVSTFSADKLAHGVNLGNLTSGAIHDQGDRIFQAIQKKNQILHQRFRRVIMSNMPATQKNAERQRLMAQIDQQQAEIYKLAQPVAHRFELRQTK